MDQSQSEPNAFWNTFYQDAWKSRTDLIKQIYQDGETHPLRVLKKYESILRLSDQPPGLEGHVRDSRYDAGMHSNVATSDGNLVLHQTHHIPTGSRIAKEVVFVDEVIRFSPLFDTVSIKFLADFLRMNDFDAVVELGSGLGANLVRLYYEGGPDVPYYAGEFSESGTECAQFFSDICKDFTLVPFRYDHTKPDLSIVKENKRVFVFTIHSIEQVPELPAVFFEEVASIADHVTCFHIEPFGWQLANLSNSMNEIDKNQMQFTVNQGWNMNLLPTLNAACLQGKINLRYIGKNVFPSIDVENPSSLAHWETP